MVCLIWSSHLNTYLTLLSTWPFPSVTLPCTLIFCHGISWLHSWTPVLHPRFSFLCPFNYIFLPSSRTEPVSQPVYSFITSWTSTQFPLPFPSHGFLVIQLRFFFPLPFCPSREATLQPIITGWGRSFIVTSEQPTPFLYHALIIEGTSWAR